MAKQVELLLGHPSTRDWRSDSTPRAAALAWWERELAKPAPRIDAEAPPNAAELCGVDDRAHLPWRVSVWTANARHSAFDRMADRLVGTIQTALAEARTRYLPGPELLACRLVVPEEFATDEMRAELARRLAWPSAVELTITPRRPAIAGREETDG